MEMCDMTHSYVWHGVLKYVTSPASGCSDNVTGTRNLWTRLIHIYDMTYSCVIWLIHMRDMCDMKHSYVWFDFFIRMTWPIHICDMAYLYAWRAVFMYVTSRIHMCDMAHSYAWHFVFVRVKYCIHIYNILFFCVWDDPFICVTWRIHTCDRRIHMCDKPYSCVTWLLHILCKTARSYTPNDTFIRVTHSYVRHDSIIRVT